VKRPDPAAKLIARALANGATIASDSPALPSTRAPRKGAAQGGYTNRLERAAALGWEWIETADSVTYRYRTAAGASTPAGDYETVTAYAALRGPEV